MSQSEHTPTNNIAYYSAHRGPVWGPNGEFHHFARQCDPIHMLNGYWRFDSYDDDRRTYECGLDTPEAVLIAQDVGDGVYDDIMLRWVPGKLDPGNQPTAGTAALHLETIYNERRVLGKSLSFRGRVPLYSISADQRLVTYRLIRHGIQEEVVPETILASLSQQGSSGNTASFTVASASHSQGQTSVSVSAPASTHRTVDGSTPNQVQVGFSTKNVNAQPSTYRVRSPPPSASPRVAPSFAQVTSMSSNGSAGSQEQAQLATVPGLPQSEPQSPVTVSAQRSMESRMGSQTNSLFHTLKDTVSHDNSPLFPSPQDDMRLILPFMSVLTPTGTPRSTAPVRSSQSAPDRQRVPSNPVNPTPLARNDVRRASPLDPRLRGRMRLKSTYTLNSADNTFLTPAMGSKRLEEFNRTEHDEDDYIVQDSDDTTNGLTDSVCSLSCVDLTPSQLYDAQSATLPCMSCGIIRTHTSQCWIKEATLSLKATDELTVSDYRNLAADVKRFDPGPWTTHVGPLKEVALDDPHTQVQGMAETIRNLGTSVKDSELRTLDDEFTILLWALGSSSSVQIMKAVHSDSGLEESGQDEHDMPDAWQYNEI